MTRCKGRRHDGLQCPSRKLLSNGYCQRHQGQARSQQASARLGHWSREHLEAVIAERGAPDGLDLAGVDLSGLDLSEMDLHGVVFSRWLPEHDFWLCTGLAGSRLCKADLRQADLRGVVLQELDLSEARLQHADLRQADLSRAVLRAANLRKAKLQGASLEDADLSQAFLWETNLCGASLMGANLQGAKLRKTNFAGADLTMAKLQETVLLQADLRGANLTGADLRGANLRVVEGRGLFGARLQWARLEGTHLVWEALDSQIGEEIAGEYRLARSVYMALKRNFEDTGDYQAASWAYVKECRMEAMCSHPRYARRLYGEEQLGDTSKDRLPATRPRVWRFYVRHTVIFLGHRLIDWACGYGESWVKTLRAMGVTFLFFTALYWATWAVVKEVPRLSGIVDFVPTRNLLDILIFTAGAFTTMDPKGVGPLAPWVQLLATLEALLGIGLTGLLGFVLGNRIRRR